MQFPKLKMLELDDPIVSNKGDFTNPCAQCSLANECVKDCCHKDCTQVECYRDCNNCGGSRDWEIEDGVSGVPALCSKAPLRHLYLDIVRKESYNFEQRDCISLKNKAVIVTQGSAGRTDYDWYPEETEAIGVTLRHVWSTNGWFSQDLKDYLRIPSGVKLILSTSMLDDVLDRAAAKEVYREDFAAYGFDYWHPLDFSTYDNMSRFNNIWQDYRTLFTLEASKAHFSLTPSKGLSRRKLKQFPNNVWVEAARAAPNVFVHLQFLNARKDIQQIASMLAELRRWQMLVESPLTFWFMGVTTASVIGLVKRVLPDNDCYFMAVTPWLAAHKGSEFTIEGKSRKSKLPKSELVLQNQRNYARLVQTATV